MTSNRGEAEKVERFVGPVPPSSRRLSARQDREIAHAVALERERIAAWLDDAVWSRRVYPSELAAHIRSGAHNTPPEQQEGWK